MEEQKWKYICITILLVALIGVFVFNSGGFDKGSYLLVAILIFPLGALILVLIFSSKKKKEEQARREEEDRRKRAQQASEFKMNNEKLAAALKRYNIRMQEIGFDKVNKADLKTIYEKYSNSDNFYGEYTWLLKGQLFRIRQEPNINNFDDPAYENPALIKPFYCDVDKINYITIEGNLCVLYYDWKPFYFRSDALGVFRQFVPDKIK